MSEGGESQKYYLRKNYLLGFPLERGFYLGVGLHMVSLIYVIFL